MKTIDSIITAQLRQLKGHFPVETYDHIETVTEERFNKMRSIEINEPIVKLPDLKEHGLTWLYNQYLKNWSCALTAGLLRDVFFSNYHQAYNALKHMEKMNLLYRADNSFWVKHPMIFCGE